jgi:hypothetical protein
MPNAAGSAERERPATPAAVKSPNGAKAVESRGAAPETLESRRPAAKPVEGLRPAAKATETRSVVAHETWRR